MELDNQVAKVRRRLEGSMGKTIGDPTNPLLVSVRSGVQASMPGMMDTVLNLGLNDESVDGLARQTNDQRFPYDSYHRFIAMYGRIVLNVSEALFNELFEQAKNDAGVTSDAAVPVEDLQKSVSAYKDVVVENTGSAFPQDPSQQLRDAIEAVFRSWNGPRAIAYRQRERIAPDLGTAVSVRAMVFGNRDDNSGTGVGFTRNPATGAKRAYGDFLVNAQGEDVVAGIRNPEPLTVLKRKFPAIHVELHEIFDRLEHHYRDMCDVEFTVECAGKGQSSECCKYAQASARVARLSRLPLI
jgi:pyruvate,orthophosphate dikinase